MPARTASSDACGFIAAIRALSLRSISSAMFRGLRASATSSNSAALWKGNGIAGTGFAASDPAALSGLYRILGDEPSADGEESPLVQNNAPVASYAVRRMPLGCCMCAPGGFI